MCRASSGIRLTSLCMRSRIRRLTSTRSAAIELADGREPVLGLVVEPPVRAWPSSWRLRSASGAVRFALVGRPAITRAGIVANIAPGRHAGGWHYGRIGAQQRSCLPVLGAGDAVRRGDRGLVLDGFISSLEGNIGAFPRRLLVPDGDLAGAPSPARRRGGSCGADDARWLTPRSMPCSAAGSCCASRRTATAWRSTPCCWRPPCRRDPASRCSMPVRHRCRGLVPRRARAGDAPSSASSATPELLALARANVAANGLEDRVTLTPGDLMTPPEGVAHASFDHVMTNPPFGHDGGWHGRRQPSGEPPTSPTCRLPTGSHACLRRLRPGGSLTLIHRADQLPAILAGTARPGGRRRRLPVVAQGGCRRAPAGHRPGAQGRARARARSRAASSCTSPMGALPPRPRPSCGTALPCRSSGAVLELETG